jgi:ssDNA-binding Zn-finger/Zn-ribbon topoisomerase 1
MEGDKYSCPACGNPLTLRHGRQGEFWGCSAYPRCRVALAAGTDGAPVPPPGTGKKCGACDAPAAVKRGPRGLFWACATYPQCRWTEVHREDNA